jgi:hypothetical protein
MALQSSSSFRRHGQRDDRRRRLLTDELANSDDQKTCHVWPEDAPPRPKSEGYGDAVFLDQQLRLLDLIPRRRVTLLALLAVATAIVVGLEFSYAWMIGRVASGGVSVAALDLAAKGSLASWFSSLMLLAASVAALLVYAVRRHRIDDYQGRYRIWLWAAACWFLWAGDQAASLREAFRDLMIAATGTPLVGDGTLWWAALYVILLGAVGSRLLMDMRPCRFSMATLLAAATAHVVAIAGRLGWIFDEAGSQQVMILAGAEMVGNLMLLAAMVWHARYVLRDAEGLLPRREQESGEEPADEVTSGDEVAPPISDRNRWVKVDPPHGTSQPAFQRAATPRSPSTVASSPPTSASISSPVNRKLTKQERKALKERLLRERLERQRRRL